MGHAGAAMDSKAEHTTQDRRRLDLYHGAFRRFFWIAINIDAAASARTGRLRGNAVDTKSRISGGASER